MVSQKYRWDFIGLSTDEKPTSETSDKVVNGSTYYCSDTSKLYVYCDGTWYERKPLGGGGGGGAYDFNDLPNRPKYNGSDMTGSTNIPEVVTYSDFTGTDGTTAGTAGLVPAPATTDAGKFLKADGTWDTAGGGGGAEFIELTTADYNWNSSTGQTGTPNCVALWLLPSGIYKGPASTSIEVRATRIQDYSMGAGFSSYAIVKECENTNTNRAIVTYVDGANGSVVEYYSIDENGQNYSTKNFPNVVQSTGTSTTNVMSQNATTSMVFADPSTRNQVQIGGVAAGLRSVAIGLNAQTATGNSYDAVAIGRDARSSHGGSVALGAFSDTSAVGEVNIGTSSASYGYTGNSNYRLLTGLYDPQSDHDAATKGYVDPTTDSSAPTTATVGRLGQIQIDTTNNDAYMCVAVDDVTPAYTWKKITV